MIAFTIGAGLLRRQLVLGHDFVGDVLVPRMCHASSKASAFGKTIVPRHGF